MDENCIMRWVVVEQMKSVRYRYELDEMKSIAVVIGPLAVGLG
jgi:hypothetical protein